MLAAALCGLATFLAAAVMLLKCPQLGGMGGLVDEWYILGINILNHGTLGIGGEPTVLRAPGYPLFVAVALRFLGGFAVIGDYESVTAGQGSVYWAQALCLAAAATILCVWLQRFLCPRYAFLAALSFGVNPYSLLLVGLLRYDVLLWMVICACGLAAQLWLDKTDAG
jgi:hypothetical protein